MIKNIGESKYQVEGATSVYYEFDNIEKAKEFESADAVFMGIF